MTSVLLVDDERDLLSLLDFNLRFSVGEHDIFPEEFRHFLGLQEPLRSVFMQRHADLFEAEFWNGLQARLNAGEVIDIFPYDRASRIAHPVEAAVAG